MIKKVLLMTLVCLLCFCGSERNDVKRLMEEGIEVIVNPLKLSKNDKKKSPLILEEEFTIDLEDEGIAALGLTDVRGFDVDSQENIYVFKPEIFDGNLVYKFARNGNFLFSFAPKGQGPEELGRPMFQKINALDELPVTDFNDKKIKVFNSEGKLIKEIFIDSRLGSMGSIEASPLFICLVCCRRFTFFWM